VRTASDGQSDREMSRWGERCVGDLGRGPSRDQDQSGSVMIGIRARTLAHQAIRGRIWQRPLGRACQASWLAWRFAMQSDDTRRACVLGVWWVCRRSLGERVREIKQSLQHSESDSVWGCNCNCQLQFATETEPERKKARAGTLAATFLLPSALLQAESNVRPEQRGCRIPVFPSAEQSVCTCPRAHTASHSAARPRTFGVWI